MKSLGPPNVYVKKLKTKAFQLLLHPLKNALRLLQFGMCIVVDICDGGGREEGGGKFRSP